MGRVWRVVGGSTASGLLVREGRELTSPELPERLQTQSIVEELEVVGARFHYQLQRGHGPNSGWISSKLKGRPLLVRADVRDTGKQLGTNAPIPELLYVQGSEKHGTLREVQGRGLGVWCWVVLKLGTLDELEQAVLKHLEGNPSAASKQFQGLLEDMVFLAWRRENRQRVLLFLGKQLEFCSKTPHLKDAARIICEQLCLVSWASSMVDVEYYSFRDEQSPLVLLCGFGGSHLDDLQPAIEHWTEKGFGVLAFGPARLGREDMLDLIHAKLLELCCRRSVVVHLFSDGGFGFARALLSMWDESWRKQQTQEDPHLALKCIICDGAGLLPHEDVPIDPTEESPVEPVPADETQNSEALKKMTNTALAFFTGCGLNMLMNFGACQAFHEEPANSFGKTLVQLANSGQLAGKLSSAPRGPLLGIWRLLRGVPVLLIASQGDRVVPLERSLSLVAWFKKLPERQLVGQRRKETAILGEDGAAVHTLILEKALHCKAMTSHAVEYWEAVDDLANCDGLREELDAVRFRRLLEETLGQSHGAMPKPLIRLLRSFGRRALYGRRRSPYGRRAFAQFQQACTGQGPKGFVLGAVPQILRLMDRLVDEGRRTMTDAVEDGGDDPWLDGMPEETENKGRGLPDWEKLDGILSEPQNLESLQAEADAFLAETSMPKPLCLSKAERAAETTALPDSGSFAPRGRRPAAVGPGDDGAADAAKQGSRRLFASVGPYYSCDPGLLLKVAKAPLPNLDTLVNSLVPGAELTTEIECTQDLLASQALDTSSFKLRSTCAMGEHESAESLEARNRKRAADPVNGADVFQLPEEMVDWYRSLDSAGARAASEAKWWQDFLKDQCDGAGGWTRNWPIHAKHPELNHLYVHRHSAPMHFVIGRQSPFYIERCFRNDRKRAVWAVYFGPFCSNGDYQVGVGNGGAIAALLDLMTATLGNIYLQGRCPTLSLSVKMLKPVLPMPGLFKAEAWIEKEEAGRLYTKAEFSDGQGVIFDVCEAGLLLQLADEELVVMAYALEQIAEAASRRLVKDLEVRDELRSTCMHRREYLQLLEGALSRS
eukprot:s2168_g5.t2